MPISRAAESRIALRRADGKTAKNAARPALLSDNLATLKHLTLNLIHPDAIKRKGGIKARRLIAATSDSYREHFLGLV